MKNFQLAYASLRFPILFFVALIIGFTSTNRAKAGPQIPNRTVEQLVSYAEYEWDLYSWSEKEFQCSIIVDHQGIPNFEEVYSVCGKSVYEAWITNPFCSSSSNDGQTNCNGIYFVFRGKKTKKELKYVEISPPTVFFDIQKCKFQFPSYKCAKNASFVFLGIEPLRNQMITETHIVLNGVEKICTGEKCELAIGLFRQNENKIEYWSKSSLGDDSIVYTASVFMSQVVEDTDFISISIFSDQDILRAGCSNIWNVEPKIHEGSTWLSTPQEKLEMETFIPYQYLAGQLISNGLSNPENCSNKGLSFSGYANQCGLEKSISDVLEWQNQFDGQIFSVAQESGFPAELIKRMIAKESQFWPGYYAPSPNEYGFIRMTQDGADTVLRWNQELFIDQCNGILLDKSCARGYSNLGNFEQTIVRNAFVQNISGYCLNCSHNVDLLKASESISLFPAILESNCSQVDQIIENVTEIEPGDLVDYDDLWRFTLVNYNAGPGCLYEAINIAWNSYGNEIDWENVSTSLVGDCSSAIDYVESIASN